MPPRNRSKARVDGGRSQTLEHRRVRKSADAVDGVPVAQIPARPVRIHNGHLNLRVDRRAVAEVIRELDTHWSEILGSGSSGSEVHPVPAGELSIAFLTDRALARLHATFLDDPSITDVITFEGTPALGQAGEICVSADTARSFAAGHRRDFSEELTLYVVHGWLHLAGHDDRQSARKKRMRAAEARALALLRARRIVPQFALGAESRRNRHFSRSNIALKS
jgi:probable rRNA maturation factor